MHNCDDVILPKQMLAVEVLCSVKKTLMPELMVMLAGDCCRARPWRSLTNITLDNGMRVIVKEDHRAPVVVSQIWYRAGCMDEFNGTTGVAHVLEHMMFKGTQSVPPGEFSKRIAAAGGRENAFTSRDYTAYFQQLQKSTAGAGIQAGSRPHGATW